MQLTANLAYSQFLRFPHNKHRFSIVVAYVSIVSMWFKITHGSVIRTVILPQRR